MYFSGTASYSRFWKTKGFFFFGGGGGILIYGILWSSSYEPGLSLYCCLRVNFAVDGARHFISTRRTVTGESLCKPNGETKAEIGRGDSQRKKTRKQPIIHSKSKEGK